MDGPDGYRHLLAPGRIGTMELRNRIVMTPMGDLLSNDDGSVSDTQIAYYGARARGGAAMVVVGSMQPAYPLACLSHRDTAISDRRYLPGLARLSGAVHAHGARIAAQIKHIGQYALEDIAAGRPLLVPSAPLDVAGGDQVSLLATEEELAARTEPFAAPGARLDYREATEEDLEWVVDRFAAAAELAAEAGFDGVEIHAGHGYLIDMFLSPASNRRTDRWGGPVDNRARLLVHVVEAVRRRVGSGYPLWCRLNGAERLIDGGETVDDAVAVARLAVAAGLDAVHVTANANQLSPLGVTEGHTPHRPGALLPYAAAVKHAVAVPVIAVGRIEPSAGDAAIGRGDADFIAMGRKLLADPDLPRKLAEGRDPEIRPCIYHYRCVGNGYLRKSVVCAVNAETGREGLVLGRRPARSRSWRVLVVGGGPAGMEVARLLAERDHRVTLADRSPSLGGRLGLAAWTDPDLRPYLEWLRQGVSRAGITVQAGRTVTPRDADVADADAVVLATGARASRPPARLWDPLPLRTLDDLAGWPDDSSVVGTRTVVLGANKTGLSLAMAAAAQGSTVVVLGDAAVVAPELGPPGRAQLMADLDDAGVRVAMPATALGVRDGAVWWTDRDGEHRFAADLVLSTALGRPATSRWDPGVLRIGDCDGGARSLESAIAGAARVCDDITRRAAVT